VKKEMAHFYFTLPYKYIVTPLEKENIEKQSPLKGRKPNKRAENSNS
jgi:hypothetical protein